MASCSRLIVAVDASERYENYVTRSLLEYPDKWKGQGGSYDPQAISIHVWFEKSKTTIERVKELSIEV